MSDDLEPLKALTPEQQDEFENRRETAAVVQIRCKACSAWYETPKRSQPFTESFFCDCASFMQFEVPALSLPALGAAIDYSDPDPRLDTGMRLSEALASASHWWGKIGRYMIKKQAHQGKAVVSLDPDDANYLPSGIVNGEPWDQLDRREKLTIVKHWHHFHVRKPQGL